ncbi:TIGR02611 family protein [Melissospora conviva]|uniref:TIGR02611 family protein n=1 Tax=Melissospora conviva TaxID=3388432 RepID=UPI003C1532C5
MVSKLSSAEPRAPKVQPGETVESATDRETLMPGDEKRSRNGAETDVKRDSATTSVIAPKRKRGKLRTALDLIRANPTGRVALRIFISVAGALVVAVGVVLIPLPGPGWLLVIAGLAIWGVEFHWAKRLLGFTRRNVQRWTRWIGAQIWPVRLAVGAVGLVFVSLVVWLSLKYSFGIDVIAEALHYIATH